MKKLIENEYGCLWIENGISHTLSGIFIHWDIYKWNLASVKYYKQIWNDTIVRVLKDKYGSVYAVPPTEFEAKLIGMFGFVYTGIHFQGSKLYKYQGKENK